MKDTIGKGGEPFSLTFEQRYYIPTIEQLIAFDKAIKRVVKEDLK